MKPIHRILLGLVPLVLGCASSSRGTHTLPPTTGLVSVGMTSTGSEDWAEIDVKIVQVSLTPQGGGEPLNLLAPQGEPLPVNLALLGGATQLLGSFAAPLGTYTSATVTLATDTRDIALTSSSTPSPGFLQAPQTNVSTLAIVGAGGKATLALQVPLGAPLVVTTDRNSVLNLEWDTSRPGFITGAKTPSNTNFWTLSLENPVRQRAVADPAAMTLLPLRGTVYKTDPSRQTFQVSPAFRAGIFPTGYLPQLVGVSLDAAAGTTFYDVDLGTRQVIKDLASVGDALPGRLVCVGGALQQDGTLRATRIWAGKGEFLGTHILGRVVRVNPGLGLAAFDGDSFTGFSLGSGGFTTPDTIFAAPGMTAGPDFLAAGDLSLGFTATPFFHYPSHGSPTLVAVEIVSPDFKGAVTAVDGNQVSLSCPSGSDAPALNPALPFIAPGTANGYDAAGKPLQGFVWWEAGSPDTVHAGTASFSAAAAAKVDFGGTLGAIPVSATVHAAWGNAANPSGWSAQWAVLETLTLPVGTVAVPYASTGFGLALPGGDTTVLVDMDASTACYRFSVPSATWYGVNPWPTLTAVAPSAALTQGVAVQVFGIPQANGHLKARTVFQCVYSNY
ncbi:DUF4382 domain-containing protein [Mesoterricola silvestris]|uniref:DUF4382 domain-containing protein n=1 Tax=Mesoterricola silvestris TaxID=2927979 RepID=A0AA48K7L7_9BACT|nr:DUF4382 domain-containing protein [Mesoterricola silvestris]BDU71271.1 hypothetical protein METEAL_04450 [Mesoterricola silvestris]